MGSGNPEGRPAQTDKGENGMNQDTQGIWQLLEKLVEENEQQNRHLQKQLRVTKILAAAGCATAGILLAALLCIVPPLLRTVHQASGLIQQVSVTVENVDGALAQVTQTLTEADKALLGIQSMFDEDGLMNQTEDALTQVMEKLESMDIESLNRAIRDLGDVVEPLAEFFNRFH